MEKSTIRRSVALPRILVEEALLAAPEGLRGNLNSLVKVALKEYIARRKASQFEQAMEEMALDPDIQSISQDLSQDFRATEMDGL